MKKILAVFVIFIYGCTMPTKNLPETFIIPLDTAPVYKTTDKNVPPPPPSNNAYYFPSNFIIDTGEQIFFYQQQQNNLYNDVVVDWDTPAEFINLKPKDLIRVPTENLQEFIKLNILNLETEHRLGWIKRFVGIASTQDTIKSVGLAKILTILKGTSSHVQWKLRKVTQEESVVLDFKKRQINYYPDEIKWDSTKTLYPDLDKDIKKFLPPKIDD